MVKSGSRTLHFPGRRQKIILSLLLVSTGQTVPTERIVDAIWSDALPPRTCRQQVQNCTAALRRAVQAARTGAEPSTNGDIVIESVGSSGYRLRAGRGSVDAFVFEDSLRASLNDHQLADTQRIQLLRSALGLWTGTPFAGLATMDLQAEAMRLEELRLLAIEEVVERELRNGREAALCIAELSSLTTRYPYRERPWLLLMEALHRSGRTAEAIDRFRQYRTILVRDHGIEPGVAIREKEREILQRAG